MNLLFELPFYNPNVGGIVETIKLAQRMNAQVRFQRHSQYPIPEQYGYSIGMPDSTFPKCDVCITYSDNPYLSNLLRLKQIGRVMIYMLSYGMSIDRERKNIHTKGIDVLCSTKKIEEAIHDENVDVNRIGFALDMDDMYDEGKEREDNLAIYYHPMPSKNYKMAVDIADAMFGSNYITGIHSFGTSEGYRSFDRPVALSSHTVNADRTQIREIFNKCKLFINPSYSEGLNLTPIEATLCGCPSVIVDGAKDEIFIDGLTCFISNNNFFDLYNDSIELMAFIDSYKDIFKDNMRRIVKEYTWDRLIENINKIL